VLHSDTSSGQRVREQKARVAGKSYSLERKVSSTRWCANGEPEENNESEKGRCSRGMSTIRQRGKKGSTQELYHKERRHTVSARGPEHGRSMAYATMHNHIGLLTIRGASAARRVVMTNGGKEVRNEWSQYGPRTVTVRGNKYLNILRFHRHCENPSSAMAKLAITSCLGVGESSTSLRMPTQTRLCRGHSDPHGMQKNGISHETSSCL
jgi:hypothetical protein